MITTFCARPPFIECASLSKELGMHHEEVVINTSHHSDHNLPIVFMDDLARPGHAHYLNVGPKNHGRQTAEIPSAVEDVLIKVEPYLVVVIQVTNSNLAGAQALTKLHIPNAQVEAAVGNLRAKKVTDGVGVVGNVIAGSVLLHLELARRNSNILERPGKGNGRYLVAANHCQCNTDCSEGPSNIIQVLGGSERTVFLQSYPRTKSCLSRWSILGRLLSNIIFADPLRDLDPLRPLREMDKVVIYSGGAQLMAYTMGVLCIIMRDTADWPDTVEDGWNVLVRTIAERILTEIATLALMWARTCQNDERDACVSIASIFELDKDQGETPWDYQMRGSGKVVRSAG